MVMGWTNCSIVLILFKMISLVAQLTIWYSFTEPVYEALLITLARSQLWLPVEQFVLVGVLLELVVSSTAYCLSAPKSGHRCWIMAVELSEGVARVAAA